MFENAIQACSDLAKHVASRNFDFDGNTSREAIRILGRESVIDEATSAVDTATELAIQRGLARLTEGRTTNVCVQELERHAGTRAARREYARDSAGGKPSVPASFREPCCARCA